jgi:GTPase SAR1 family protein
MANFQFKEEAQKIENLCNESIELLSIREEQEIKNLVSDFKLFLSEHNKQKKITIGFIGQYSAGKSTIIVSLTKAEFVKKYYKEVGDEKKLIEVYRVDSKELTIGVQITTDKTESYN